MPGRGLPTPRFRLFCCQGALWGLERNARPSAPESDAPTGMVESMPLLRLVQCGRENEILRPKRFAIGKDVRYAEIQNIDPSGELMPRIFDNLKPETKLAPALQETLKVSDRADFCVGYFNLRGWRNLAPYVDAWSPSEGPCRVLIGMQRLPNDELREALNPVGEPTPIDASSARRMKREMAEELRRQLMMGAPDERGREDAAPPRRATSRGQGRRQAIPAPRAPRQALPAVPRRLEQPDHRLPRQ